MAELQINGICEAEFLPLREAFAANFEDGHEWGAALAATQGGKPVVDLWAGGFSPSGRTPWAEDTIVNVASVSKVIGAICTLMLVDRGLLELDMPICHYWPEFAQGGKDKATVRHALAHMAGVPGLKEWQREAVLNDFVYAASLVAKEPAWFEPGTSWIYHANTYGLILGELIRRVDGRGPAQFLAHEISGPLGVDFSFGVPVTMPFSRISTMIAVDELAMEPGSQTEQVMMSFALDPMPTCPIKLARQNPSGDGFGNARALARILAIIAHGGVLEGRHFLSESLIDEALTPQYQGETEMFGAMSYGLGFGLDNPGLPAPTPTAAHWGGRGGHWVVVDHEKQISIAYTMNRGMAPKLANKEPAVLDPRQQRFWDVMCEVLPTL